MSAALALAQALIRRPSLTPDDGGCQDLLGQRLAALGFRLETLRFGNVDNLWARRGDDGPLFVFAGHTDVVPVGDPDAWRCAPFAAEVHDGLLYGRGAADMKSALAAMVVACERFLATCPQPAGSIAFLITSDEEGDAIDGTVRVMHTLAARNQTIDWCLIGEPSSDQRLGDTLRIGRRGSLSARLHVHGVLGHVAYPEKALNPIHAFAPTLAALCAEPWGGDDPAFPPVSFQISNIHAGTGAGNVIPGELIIDCNFRFPPQPGAATARRHEGGEVGVLDEGVGEQLGGLGEVRGTHRPHPRGGAHPPGVPTRRRTSEATSSGTSSSDQCETLSSGTTR